VYDCCALADMGFEALDVFFLAMNVLVRRCKRRHLFGWLVGLKATRLTAVDGMDRYLKARLLNLKTIDTLDMFHLASCLIRLEHTSEQKWLHANTAKLYRTVIYKD
jgi:hypothetical protein